MKTPLVLSILLVSAISNIASASEAKAQRFHVATTNCSVGEGEFDKAKFVKSSSNDVLLQATFISFPASAAPAADDTPAAFDYDEFSVRTAFERVENQIIHRESNSVCAVFKKDLFGITKWKTLKSCKFELEERNSSKGCQRDYTLKLSK